MAYDVTFTQAVLCKGVMRTIGQVLNVDDETARMLVDLGVATASGLSPQTGSSAALFADTFLAKTDNLSTVASPVTSRSNLDVPSTSAVTSEITSSISVKPRKAGEWSNSVSYAVGDFVLFGNASFVCVQDHTNRNPVAEMNYWQIVSTGWNWLPAKQNTNLAFSNARTIGSGVDSSQTSNTIYVRMGLGTNNGSAINGTAVYRVLSIGVPTYWHKLYDSSQLNSNNSINFGRAGRFQSTFATSQTANAFTGGTSFYLDVGRTYSEVGGSGTISPINAPLDKRGFGIRLVGNAAASGIAEAYAVIHNGTTLTETSISPSFVQTQMNKLDITWDGLGTMIWFINGTEVWRTSSGFSDVWGIPTWGSIALGVYNNNSANNATSASQAIFSLAEETYFVTYGG